MIRNIRRRNRALPNIVLLGDSIFDNKTYVGPNGVDVAGNLAGMLRGQASVTLLARNGATTKTLCQQLPWIPPNAAELFVSIGGNDAMSNAWILWDDKPYTLVESLELFAQLGEEFAVEYSEAVMPLLDVGVPVTICTIYECDFPEGQQEAVRGALATFNDVIIRFALAHELPILDLRLVCTAPEDYTANIEPSWVGGTRIAGAIASRVAVGPRADRLALVT